MRVLGIFLEHRCGKFNLASWIVYFFHYELAMMPNLIVFQMLHSHTVEETLLFSKVLPQGK